MKVTRNFDFDKLIQSQALSVWLNQYGNRITQSIQEGLDTVTDIVGNRFDPGGKFTHKSVQDGHAHKRPLVRSGRLKKSVKKFPATPKKLTFIIKSNVKSKARWNIEVEGRKSSGTRNSRGINYGAIHNKGEHKTSDKSMVPNKKVPMREWFGIPSKFLIGGSEWDKMVTLMKVLRLKHFRTTMKEYK